MTPSADSLIDSHCHLDMAAYHDDLDAVVQRAIEHNVSHIVTIGTDLASSQQALALAQRYPLLLSAAVGVHPHDVATADASTYQQLRKLAAENRRHVVAYGEIGLDYAKQYTPSALQRQHFQQQLELADELQLPVIIHDRDAHADILSILKQSSAAKTGGVLHCFSGNRRFAEEVISLGFHISLSGVVTFKNARALHEVAATIPLTSLLLETDGPFLAPQPVRGQRNEPAFVAYTAEFVAGIRNISLAELAQQTSTNARKLFRLPKPFVENR